MDRYDDREVIITNLIDSYRKLMEFGKKHLNDLFVLDGDQSISARDKIWGNVAELQVGPEESSKENEITSKETKKTSQKTDRKKGKAVKEPAKKICDFLRGNPQMSIKELAEITKLFY